MDVSADPDPPLRRAIFNAERRALRRARHAGRAGYIDQRIADLLLERIDDVTRQFSNALIIGARNPALIAALNDRCARLTIFESAPALCAGQAYLTGQESQLPVEPEQFDLIVWPGGLESIDDVPGALLRCRLALKPDGLLIGAVAGEGSLPALRRTLVQMDAPRAIARMHPQLTIQSVGNLLQEIGLALIVTDVERMTLAYASLGALVHDLRAAALGNVLAGPSHRVSKAGLALAQSAFAAMAARNGRVEEQINLLLFAGWAPDPSQSQPAAPGSAKASLASALRAR